MALKNPKSDVLEYMLQHNRPFSLNDITLAMHNVHGKSAVSKAVDDLVSEDSLCEKVNGKQKVFVVPQNSLPRANENELRTMDNEISELTALLQAQKENLKLAESELKMLASSLTFEDAVRRNEELQREIDSVRKSIEACDPNGIQITPEDFLKAEKRRQIYLSEWRKRKRLAMEMINAVAEGYPKSRLQLMEDMSVETDESCGILPSSFV